MLKRLRDGVRRAVAPVISVVLLLGVAAPAWARFQPVTCKNGFSENQEITEGSKVATQVYGQMPVLPENDPVTRYVQALGAKLVQSAPLVPGVQKQWPFSFHVVASDEINAFALPGGSIFVNLGTIQAADTEAELAGVMAHEVSHVVMRHSTCNLGRQRNKSILYSLGAIGSSILLGNGAAGQLAQTGIGLGQNLDFMHMSRGDEQQADLLGAGILYDAGYDPRGLPQFFEVIQAKYGKGGAQFMSDHPNPGNRTQYVNEEIATLPRRPNPTVTSASFKEMKAVATQRKALTAKEVQSGAWRGSGQYAARPGGNGAVIPVAATAGQGRQAGAGGTQADSAAATIAPLSRDALGLNDRLVPLQAARYAISYPASWKPTNDESGTVTIAPAGGAGSSGVAYGVVIGIEKQNGGGITDAASLSAASTALVQRFVTQNTGLAVAGTMTSRPVGGRSGFAINLRGGSPVAANGGQGMERDWLVMAARPDGDLSYMVFVAPEIDFGALRPVFEAMVSSFRPQ